MSAVTSRTESPSFVRRFLRHRGAVIALVVLLVIILATAASVIFNLDGNTSDMANRWAKPSIAHPIGTDDLGRDYLSRVARGGAITLFVGFFAAAASTLIGVTLGLISGFFGGLVDDIIMRLVDLLSSIPWMLLVIVASVFLRPGMWTMIIIIGTLSWMSTARLVRAETLAARERTYVGYASFIGERSSQIILRHVLPVAVPTVVVAATATVSSAMLTESALSFLGMGIQAPLASWGSLLTSAQGSLQKAPLLAIVPGLLIAITVFCVNVVGNGVRAAATREGGR